MLEIMSTILIVVLLLVLVSPIAIFLIAVIDFVCEIIESNRDVEVVVRDYCSAVKKNFGRVREAWKILRRK